MRRLFLAVLAVCLAASQAPGQEFVPTPAAELLQNSPSPTPAPSPASKPKGGKKQSWINKMMHPFGGSSSKRQAPEYADPKLRGLVLDLKVSPETIKLSEVRQLEVKVTLVNTGKRAAELDFANDQRIEIFLMNSSDIVLTRWSDNHAVSPKSGTLLINPGEQVEYNESIATRDLAPNKVFIIDVFFPKYPELRVRQKFLTAP